MKICLVGYMGCGKTTIGKLLSEETALKFYDLDKYISKKENMPITDLFKKKGEVYFRKIETKYLQEILQNKEKIILALGGGTPCFGNNMKYINQYTDVSIFVDISTNNLFKRLHKKKFKRPLIAHLSDSELTTYISKHLFERRKYYEQAKWIISGKDSSSKEIVHLIMDRIRNITPPKDI